MSLFGLLLAGLGLGYAQHKSVQNINNMRANAERTYGSQFLLSHQKKEFGNKRAKEVVEYWNSRVSYYWNNPDKINCIIYPEEIKSNETTNGLYLRRMCAGQCASKDVNTKFAPNYESYWKERFGNWSFNIRKCGGTEHLQKVAMGLGRVDIFNAGGLPSHMGTRMFPLYCEKLYFQEGDELPCMPPKEYEFTIEDALKDEFFTYDRNVTWKDDPKWDGIPAYAKEGDWEHYLNPKSDDIKKKIKRFKALLDAGKIEKSEHLINKESEKLTESISNVSQRTCAFCKGSLSEDDPGHVSFGKLQCLKCYNKEHTPLPKLNSSAFAEPKPSNMEKIQKNTTIPNVSTQKKIKPAKLQNIYNMTAKLFEGSSKGLDANSILDDFCMSISMVLSFSAKADMEERTDILSMCLSELSVDVPIENYVKVISDDDSILEHLSSSYIMAIRLILLASVEQEKREDGMNIITTIVELLTKIENKIIVKYPSCGLKSFTMNKITEIITASMEE